MHVARKRSEDTDGGCQPQSWGAGNAAMGGFKAVYATVCRGDTDGAATVSAVGDGDKAGTHCISRTAGGPAGVVVWVVRVEGSAVRGVVIGSI